MDSSEEEEEEDILEKATDEFNATFRAFTQGMGCFRSLLLLTASREPLVSLVPILHFMSRASDKSLALSSAALLESAAAAFPVPTTIGLLGGPEAIMGEYAMPLAAAAGFLYQRAKHTRGLNWALELMVAVAVAGNEATRKQVRWWLRCLPKGPPLPPALASHPPCALEIICTALHDPKTLKKLKKFDENRDAQNALLRDVLGKALVGASCPLLVPPLSGGVGGGNAITVTEFHSHLASGLKSRERLPFVISLPPIRVIVKEHDDLRQERFCIDMFRCFNRMWDAAGVTQVARVAVYGIHPTQVDSGFMEYLAESQSIHDMKAQGAAPNVKVSLDDVLTTKGIVSRSAFIGSVAAGSAASYIMWVKDRHNANVMIGPEGVYTHVDFGFYLMRAPGGRLSVETAPFKMNAQMVKAMGEGGLETFKTLFVACMEVLTSHSEEICSLVEIVLTGFPDFLCLDGNKPSKAVQEMKERLKIPKKGKEGYLRLLEDAMDDHGCETYDNFQSKSNGILA